MIHRKEHKDNFTVISNEVIRADLSDGAKVLLLFMLSCSDDWSFSLKGLALVLDMSERTISDRLAELKKAGYISQRRSKNKKGQFDSCFWDVYENPLTTPQKNHSVEKVRYGKNHTAEKPQCGETTAQKTAVTKEIPIIRNTNLKELPKVNIFRPPTFEEVSAYCQERNNGIDPEQFIDFYQSKGWLVGKTKMKDWKACVRTWERNRKNKPNPIRKEPEGNPFTELLKEEGYL